MPRGARDGMSIKMKGKGNYNGDLVVKLTVNKHPTFTR